MGYSIFPDGSIGFETDVVSTNGRTSSEAMLLSARGGTPIALTSDPADDGIPVPSPDGRFAALVTARWDRTTDHPALAVLDMKSHAVRRLTQSTGIEVTGQWSPDGSRISFMRHFAGEITPELC